MSQIWSLNGLLSMVIILAPNSTPIVKSCTGWKRLSMNWRIATYCKNNRNRNRRKGWIKFGAGETPSNLGFRELNQIGEKDNVERDDDEKEKDIDQVPRIWLVLAAERPRRMMREEELVNQTGFPARVIINCNSTNSNSQETKSENHATKALTNS